MLALLTRGRIAQWCAALAALILVGLGASLPAQSWSPPFNHNKEHAGNGNWTSPYSPWFLVPNSNAPSPAAVFPPTSSVPPNVSISPSGLVFFPGSAWPQPDAQGRSFNAVHMAVIPKGPYQGMVLVWDVHPVIAVVNPPAGPTLSTHPQQEYQTFQSYAIVDPADSPIGGIRYRNFLLPIGAPTTVGPAQTLFCSGHAWSPYGDLVVVGGTTFLGGLAGARLTCVFNPRFPCYWPDTLNAYYPNLGGTAPVYAGMWLPGPDLVLPRWYPTATLTHGLAREPLGSLPGTLGDKERILVLGGSEVSPPTEIDRANRTYEALVVVDESAPQLSNLVADKASGPLYFTPPVGQDDRVWNGPDVFGSVHVNGLDEYPRCHLLSSGEVFFAGYGTRGAWVDHDAQPGGHPVAGWTQSGNQPDQPPGTYSSNWHFERHDGSSVLFPNLSRGSDTILRVGGAAGFAGATTETVESISGESGATWESAPPMPASGGDGGRAFTNLVILPTGALLVLGGAWQDGLGVTRDILEPLLFENGAWTVLPPNPQPSPRSYHSTAVLLPDGRVFLGGGNERLCDYEIFSPAYLDVPENRPVNPEWQGTAPILDPLFQAYVLQRDTLYELHFDKVPLGQAITKVVLMAPGSVTHHSDMHQRYVELRVDVVEDGHQVKFSCTQGETVVPRGIYMLFVVTNASVSHAIWVMFQ